jgi:hypothetical protein
MDDLWYNVYSIESRQLHFSLSLHIYELKDDLTWTSILKTNLNDFPLMNKTSDMADIQIISLGTNQLSTSHEYKYLLVRQPSSMINKTAEVKYNDEFMIINKSELNLNEDDTCKTIFSETDHPTCSIRCSNKQPFDFWLSDKV